MTILDADIVFRASERMTDFADGGGRMSTVVVLDNVDNNVFDDVTDLERLFGSTSLRKVYAACLSASDEVFLDAHVLLDQPAEDDATSAVLFSFGGIGTTRAEAVAALEQWHRLPAGETRGVEGSAGGTVLLWRLNSQSDPFYPAAGEGLGLRTSTDTAVTMERVLVQGDGGAIGLAGLGPGTTWFRQLVVAAPLQRTYTVGREGGPVGGVTALAYRGVELDEVRPYGVATTTANASSGATSLAVDSTSAQLVPYAGGGAPYPTANLGIDPAPFAYSQGKVKCVRNGDALLVHHTTALAPQAVSNGQTVNVGRINLARLRVLGSTGAEQFRATRGQPSVGAGITADLDAGTITFTSVAGLSQPVTIEHRIEEMVLATTVTDTSAGINRPLSRAYPAGTRVSSLLMVGDLQARSGAGFPQQAWTGVWADTPIGGAPVGDYNAASHPIQTTNRGGVTERWAAIFNNTTSFRLIGESLGEVGVGSTGANFAPVNPATGVPYLTIPAAGWGAGWAGSNVYRFPTTGANAPVWGLRCVVPSLPGADDKVVIQLRGFVGD